MLQVGTNYVAELQRCYDKKGRHSFITLLNLEVSSPCCPAGEPIHRVLAAYVDDLLIESEVQQVLMMEDDDDEYWNTRNSWRHDSWRLLHVETAPPQQRTVNWSEDYSVWNY